MDFAGHSSRFTSNTLAPTMDDVFLDQLNGDTANDWPILLIYSDYLLDHGRDRECQAIRWLVEKKRRPYANHKKRFSWYLQKNRKFIELMGQHIDSDLPLWLYSQLSLTRGCFHWMDYLSAKEAYLDVIASFPDEPPGQHHYSACYTNRYANKTFYSVQASSRQEADRLVRVYLKKVYREAQSPFALFIIETGRKCAMNEQPFLLAIDKDPHDWLTLYEPRTN